MEAELPFFNRERKTMRKVKFINNEYYHIYNRGVDKRKIFLDEKDYLRFLRGIKEFNLIQPIGSLYELDCKKKKEAKSPFGSSASIISLTDQLVEIICYCLIPNHYHFILKQLVDHGVEKFLHKLGTGFTNYFNKKYNRSGSLFQGRYKAIHITNNNYLLWLSAYINGNNEIHKGKCAEYYQWSSFKSFLDKREDKILGDINIIVSQFKNLQSYKEFVEQVIKESKTRKEMKEYLLE